MTQNKKTMKKKDEQYFFYSVFICIFTMYL